jgi:hypothetical protein
LHSGLWSNSKEIIVMTNVKSLSAAIILSAAVVAPTLAHATHHRRGHDLSNFRAGYNQLGASYSIPRTEEDLNIQNFGFSGRDPSRTGGWDPSLHPSGS